MLKLPLEEALEEFLLELKDNKCTAQTLDAYRLKITFFIKTIKELEDGFGVEFLEDVEKKHIKAYIRKRNAKGVQANSINTELRMISGMFRYFIQEDADEEDEDKRIKINPVDNIKKPKERKKVKKAFSEENIDDLLKIYKGKGFFDVRNKTIIMMFMDTGMRMEELYRVKKEHFGKHSMKILGKGEKERFVPLSPRLKKQLLKYERARKEFMGELECPFYFVSKYKKAFGKRGLCQVAKKINATVTMEGCFHNFRRYFAVNMYKQTGKIYRVMELLGHEDVIVTQRYIRSVENVDFEQLAMETPLMNR